MRGAVARRRHTPNMETVHHHDKSLRDCNPRSPPQSCQFTPNLNSSLLQPSCLPTITISTRCELAARRRSLLLPLAIAESCRKPRSLPSTGSMYQLIEWVVLSASRRTRRPPPVGGSLPSSSLQDKILATAASLCLVTATTSVAQSSHMHRHTTSIRPLIVVVILRCVAGRGDLLECAAVVAGQSSNTLLSVRKQRASYGL